MRKAASGVIVAPALRDLSVLAAQLADWLQPRLEGATDLRVVNLAYPRGAGQSHETILFDAFWREGRRERWRGMVVRIKPTRFRVYQDDMFHEQFRVMQVLHARRVAPIAEPFWYEADPALLGAPFFVMAKCEGRVAVTIPPYMQQGWVVEATPRQRARLWEDSVRTLAALQRAPLADLGFLHRPGAAPGFDQEWDRYRRYLTWISERRPWPFLEAAWARLDARRPANRPPGLVWGDARLGNMMVGDDFRIVAVMDWEQTSLGGALQDLGWWLFSEAGHMSQARQAVDGFGSRQDTIELWQEVTGISAADVEWYEAFAGFKIACLLIRLITLRGGELPAVGPVDHRIWRDLARRLDIDWPGT